MQGFDLKIFYLAITIYYLISSYFWFALDGKYPKKSRNFLVK